MLNFMRGRDMTPTHGTWHALIAATASAQHADTALQLYSEIRTKGHLPTSKSGSALVIALAKAHELQAALLVLRDMHCCANGLTAPVEQLAAQAAQYVGESGPGTLLAWHNPEFRITGRPVRGAQLVDLARTMANVEICDARAQPDTEPAPESVMQLLRKQLDQQLDPSNDDDAANGQQQTAHTPPEEQGAHSRARRRARRKHLQSVGQRGTQQLQKHDMLPSARAVSHMTLALALGSHCGAAMHLYRALRAHGTATLAHFALHAVQLFEQLITLNCRKGDVHTALLVFDDWRACCDMLLRHPSLWRDTSSSAFDPSDADSAAFAAQAERAWQSRGADVPSKLSNVTLAYLEACCHTAAEAAEPGLEWRTHDVSAVMRQQEEAKRERNRLRPRKESHHVRAYESGECEVLGESADEASSSVQDAWRRNAFESV